MRALVWLVAFATFGPFVSAQHTCPATVTITEHATTTISVAGVVTESSCGVWEPQTIVVYSTTYATITETDLPDGLPATSAPAKKNTKSISGAAGKDAQRRDVNQILASCPNAVRQTTTRTSTLSRGTSTTTVTSCFTSKSSVSSGITRSNNSTESTTLPSFSSSNPTSPKSKSSPHKSSTTLPKSAQSLPSSHTPKPASTVLTSGPKPTKSSHASLPSISLGSSSIPGPTLPTPSTSSAATLSDLGITLVTPASPCPTLPCWFTPPNRTLSTPSTITFGSYVTEVCASACGALWMSTVIIPLPPQTVSVVSYLSTGIYSSNPSPVTAWPVYSYGWTSINVPAPWTTCPTEVKTTTSGGQCGKVNGYTVCQRKHCCGSPDGLPELECGTDKVHCGKSCLVEFGDCWDIARDPLCIPSAVIASQTSKLHSTNTPSIYPIWIGKPPGDGPPGQEPTPPPPPPPPPPPGSDTSGGSGSSPPKPGPPPPGPPPGGDSSGSNLSGICIPLISCGPGSDIDPFNSFGGICSNGRCTPDGGGSSGGGGCSGSGCGSCKGPNCHKGGGGGGGGQYCNPTWQKCEPPSDNSDDDNPDDDNPDDDNPDDNNPDDNNPDDDDPECETTYTATDKTYFCEESTVWKDGTAQKSRPQTCTKTESKVTKGCSHITGVTTTTWDNACGTTYTATDKTYFCEESTVWKNGTSYSSRPQTCTETKSQITKGCSSITGVTTTTWDRCSEETATDVTFSCSIANRTISIGGTASTITKFTTCTATKSATVSGCKVTATTTSVIEQGPSCPILNISVTPLDPQGEDGPSCPGNITVSPLDPQGEDGILPQVDSCPNTNVTMTPDDDQGEDGVCSYSRDVKVMDGGIAPVPFVSQTAVGYSMTCNGFDEYASALSTEIGSLIHDGSIAMANIKFYKNATDQPEKLISAICSAGNWSSSVSKLEACPHITDELSMLGWATAETSSLMQLQGNQSSLESVLASISSMECGTAGACLGLEGFLKDISQQYSALIGEMADAYEQATNAIQSSDSKGVTSALCALSDVQLILTKVETCSDVRSFLSKVYSTWDPVGSLSAIKESQSDIISSWKGSITCAPPTTTNYDHLQSNYWWISHGKCIPTSIKGLGRCTRSYMVYETSYKGTMTTQSTIACGCLEVDPTYKGGSKLITTCGSTMCPNEVHVTTQTVTGPGIDSCIPPTIPGLGRCTRSYMIYENIHPSTTSTDSTVVCGCLSVDASYKGPSTLITFCGSTMCPNEVHVTTQTEVQTFDGQGAATTFSQTLRPIITTTPAPSCLPDCLNRMPIDPHSSSGAFCELFGLGNDANPDTYCDCKIYENGDISASVIGNYSRPATQACGSLVCPNQPSDECITSSPGPCTVYEPTLGWCTSHFGWTNTKGGFADISTSASWCECQQKATVSVSTMCGFKMCPNEVAQVSQSKTITSWSHGIMPMPPYTGPSGCDSTTSTSGLGKCTRSIEIYLKASTTTTICDCPDKDADADTLVLDLVTACGTTMCPNEVTVTTATFSGPTKIKARATKIYYPETRPAVPASVPTSPPMVTSPPIKPTGKKTTLSIDEEGIGHRFVDGVEIPRDSAAMSSETFSAPVIDDSRNANKRHFHPGPPRSLRGIKKKTSDDMSRPVNKEVMIVEIRQMLSSAAELHRTRAVEEDIPKSTWWNWLGL